jgi:aldose 1-epimerase
MITGRRRFGTIDGRPVTMFRIRNKNGMELSVMDYGASVTGITAPDRDGVYGDVVLGYEDLDSYLTNDGCIGACVGRYANRIAGGAFELDGREYRLTVNDGENTLHGGRGWSGRIFDFRTEENAVEFSLSDRDGADGFPGDVEAKVKYTLTDENEVVMDYFAMSNSDTVLNITNHSCFNLACTGTVLDHRLQAEADFYIPVDSELIPTGEVLPVDGTVFDFRTMRPIKNGFYDHSLVLSERKPAARLYDPGSGRLMTVTTDMPAIHLYCCGMLTDRLCKKGVRCGRYSGVCLDAQFYPNAPNVPQFPSPVVGAWETYRHRTAYRFSVVK